MTDIFNEEVVAQKTKDTKAKNAELKEAREFYESGFVTEDKEYNEKWLKEQTK